jgi:hypothetical protein
MISISILVLARRSGHLPEPPGCRGSPQPQCISGLRAEESDIEKNILRSIMRCILQESCTCEDATRKGCWAISASRSDYFRLTSSRRSEFEALSRRISCPRDSRRTVARENQSLGLICGQTTASKGTFLSCSYVPSIPVMYIVYFRAPNVAGWYRCVSRVVISVFTSTRFWAK